MSKRRITSEAGFTLIEVGMAALILVVGFIGMIEAMKIGSGMMDASRRQTVANQIINHEIEKLRFASWTTISGLPTASTSVPVDYPFWSQWAATANYNVNNVVAYNGAWYRCNSAHSNYAPPNASYWTPTTVGATTDIVVIYGAIYSVSRTLTSPDPVTNIREVNFTVTWVVNTGRVDGSGNPLSFSYQRNNSAWFGKYGLNLSYQRS